MPAAANYVVVERSGTARAVDKAVPLTSRDRLPVPSSTTLRLRAGHVVALCGPNDRLCRKQ